MISPHEVCEKALNSSKADQTEAFCIRGVMRNLYVENGEVKIITRNSWIGLGVKTILSGKIGYYGGTISNEEDIHSIVKNSINIAKVSPRDPKFKSLPEPKTISGYVGRVYDDELVNIEESQVIERVKELLDEAEQQDVKVMTGLLRLNEFNFVVMNSLGIDYSHKGTTIYLHFTAKKGFGEGVVKRFSTFIDKIDFREAGEELREKTRIASESKTYTGEQELEVIIHPQELPGLLSVITFAANGEYINRRMSPWIGRIGQKVASESLTVIDDGRLDGGLRSSLADDEGVPTTRKYIIDRGVLRNYLFDSYNSMIAGTESTGNGFRRGITSVEDAHNKMASCSSSNILVQAGNKDYNELISEIEKGVIIFKFAYPQADPITGNFGLEVRNGILIENGSETKPIKHALLAGNMYKALNNITGIGNKQYAYENYIVPFIRFGELQLIGM